LAASDGRRSSGSRAAGLAAAERSAFLGEERRGLGRSLGLLGGPLLFERPARLLGRILPGRLVRHADTSFRSSIVSGPLRSGIRQCVCPCYRTFRLRAHGLLVLALDCPSWTINGTHAWLSALGRSRVMVGLDCRVCRGPGVWTCTACERVHQRDDDPIDDRWALPTARWSPVACLVWVSQHVPANPVWSRHLYRRDGP